MVWCNVLWIVFNRHKHASQFRSESCQVRTEENLLYSFKEDSKLKCLPGQRHLCVWQTLLSKANEGPYKGYILSVRCFLGIKPMTLAVLVSDISNWTTGMQIKVCQIWTAISTKLNYWPEHCSRKKNHTMFFVPVPRAVLTIGLGVAEAPGPEQGEVCDWLWGRLPGTPIAKATMTPTF